MSGGYDRKDRFYEAAKEAGYRSRAAFKLIEINKKYKLLRDGSRVLDLGCWPGGWLQVASPLVGSRGLVVGVDLKPIDPLPLQNVLTVAGDATDPAIQAELLRLGGGKFQAVLSDMSPHLTGIPDADRAGTAAVAELAWNIAQVMAAPGAGFVAKLFKSPEADQFVKLIKPAFAKISREELDSTRKTSNEYYVVATGFKGAPAA